jgi:hypothetical protein
MLTKLLFTLFTANAEASDDWFGKYAESIYTCDTSYFKFEKGKTTVVSGYQKVVFDVYHIEGTSCLWMYNSDGTNVGKMCFTNAATNYSWIELGIQIHGKPADYTRLNRC